MDRPVPASTAQPRDAVADLVGVNLRRSWAPRRPRVLPFLGSPAARRLDGQVTAVISTLGGLLMLAVTPVVPHHRLMALAGTAALLVGIWAWLVPAEARMWQRHAYTAVSVPTTVLGTAAAEMSSHLRLGVTILLVPMIAVACLRHTRAVLFQLACGTTGYTAYLFATLPVPVAAVGTLAGVASMIMMTVMVSMLRNALDNVVRELRSQAERDSLTGLLNRHGLQTRLAARGVTTGAALLMDIDHFKIVNDVHGHQEGDDTLVWFAGLLQDSRRDAEIAARFGGEEFVLLLPGATTAQAVRRADSIRAATATRSLPRAAPVTVSIGVAEGHLADLAGVLERADKALYRAKAGGRNRVETEEQPPGGGDRPPPAPTVTGAGPSRSTGRQPA